MNGVLPGARHCVKHQSNTSHYAPHNCEQCCLLAALRALANFDCPFDSDTAPVAFENWHNARSAARAAIAKELSEMARLSECTTAEAEFGARYAALNPDDFESLRSSEQADHALSMARIYLREVV